MSPRDTDGKDPDTMTTEPGHTLLNPAVGFAIGDLVSTTQEAISDHIHNAVIEAYQRGIANGKIGNDPANWGHPKATLGLNLIQRLVDAALEHIGTAAATPRGCCPGCCHICSAIDELDKDGTLNAVTGHVPEDLDAGDGTVNRDALHAAWRSVACHMQ